MVYEEAYRRRFRAASRKDGETNRELAVRLLDLQTKWLKKCTRGQGDARLLDNLEKTTEQKGMKQPAGDMRKWCSYCKIQGHVESFRPMRRKATIQEYGRKPPIKCFNCKQEGHTASNCPGEPAMTSSGETTFPLVQDKRRCSGKVEGQHVDEIVLDTGCKLSTVHQELVAPDSLIEGDVASIGVHMEIRLYIHCLCQFS